MLFQPPLEGEVVARSAAGGVTAPKGARTSGVAAHPSPVRLRSLRELRRPTLPLQGRVKHVALIKRGEMRERSSGSITDPGFRYRSVELTCHQASSALKIFALPAPRIRVHDPFMLLLVER